MRYLSYLMLLCSTCLHSADFTLALHRQFEPKWQGHALNADEKKQVHEAISQCYTYLDAGMQSSAFLSEDGKYVIKFFQKKPLLPPKQGSMYIPLFSEWKKARYLKKQTIKRDKMFSAYTICFDKFSQETGIIYVHFNASNTLKRSLVVTDGSGNSSSLNLDDMDFIIEKRAESVRNHLQDLIAKNDLKGVTKAICSVFELHYTLYLKGMRNRDIELARNFGFIDGKPVLFDVGRVVPCHKVKDRNKYQRKLIRLLITFRAWVNNVYPALLPECDAAIAHVMVAYYG